MKLLKELCETPGISGREQAIITIMQRELKKTCDKVTVDPTGNVVGFKKGKGKSPKKVLIAGHMDEIGFVVSHIDKKGFIRFAHRGGHIPRVLISQRVKIHGKKVLTGIVEGAPAFLSDKPEDRLKAPELHKLFIDTGMKKEDLEKIVTVGDIIVLDREFEAQGDVCIAKAFDNRVGCYVVLETMKHLEKTDAEIYAVGTAQEEVGLRGAMSAGMNIEPDFGIAIDVTAAFDTPGVEDHRQVTVLGKGVAIKINDQASISNHGIVEFMKKLAKKHKIEHQMEILPFGGTDAAGIQRSGTSAVCTLSVPTRFVHSPNEMINRNDLEATIQLLVKFIESCKSCKLSF
jgi:putative aminopeptidase FrvX